MLLNTSLKVKKQSFPRMAKELAAVSAEAISSVCAKLEYPDTSTNWFTAEEK